MNFRDILFDILYSFEFPMWRLNKKFATETRIDNRWIYTVPLHLDGIKLNSLFVNFELTEINKDIFSLRILIPDLSLTLIGDTMLAEFSELAKTKKFTSPRLKETLNCWYCTAEFEFADT